MCVSPLKMEVLFTKCSSPLNGGFFFFNHFSWWTSRPWPRPVQTASAKWRNPGWIWKGIKIQHSCVYSSAYGQRPSTCVFFLSLLPPQPAQLVPEPSVCHGDVPIQQNHDWGSQHRLVFTLSQEVLTSRANTLLPLRNLTHRLNFETLNLNFL